MRCVNPYRRKREITFFVVVVLLGQTSFGQDVELVITPAELSFDAQAKHSTLVILRNGSTSALTDVRLRWVCPENFTVTAETSAHDSLPAGGDAVWQLGVEQTGIAAGTDKVLLRVDYTISQNTTSIPHTATGVLNVVGPVLPTAESLLTVITDTTVESLTTQTPGHVYVSMTNKSKYPIAVGNITSQNEFIETQVISAPSTLQVSETAVAILGLEATETVRPGKYLFVVNVPFSWTQGMRSFSATAVAQEEIPVGVFGESEILKLLAIPSFLVLPGFLLVVTLGLLWKLQLFRKSGSDNKFILQATTPEFWLVAITFSILMAFIYPRFGLGNNYLERYELADVIKVWTISIFGFGLLGYFVVALIVRLFTWLQTKRAMQLIISVTDTPIVVLRKLESVGTGLYPNRAKLAGSNEYAYIYQECQAGQGALIVGPLLELTWSDSAGDDQRGAIDKILAANERHAATQVAKELTKADPRTFDLDWNRSGTLSGLKSISKQELAAKATRSSIAILQIN